MSHPQPSTQLNAVLIDSQFLPCVQRGGEGCESNGELLVLSYDLARASLVAETCVMLHVVGSGSPSSDRLAARLLAGRAPLLACVPVAAAAAAAAGRRVAARELAANGSPDAEGAAGGGSSILSLAGTMKRGAGTVLQLALAIRLQLAQAVVLLDSQMASAAGGQLELSASQLLTPAAVASFCSGVQLTLESFVQWQQLAAAALTDSGMGGGDQPAGAAESAAADSAEQELQHRMQEFALCLFSMAQLVPPGGPAWQSIDQALSWPGLDAALPSLLGHAVEGLEAASFFRTELAVARTPEAHAGCALLAAAALESWLRQLLSALQPEQRQPGGSELQQAAAHQLWEELKQACEVALGSADLLGQHCLPHTRQCQLRVLSTGAALLSLAADASSGRGRAARQLQAGRRLGHQLLVR